MCEPATLVCQAAKDGTGDATNDVMMDNANRTMVDFWINLRFEHWHSASDDAPTIPWTTSQRCRIQR